MPVRRVSKPESRLVSVSNGVIAVAACRLAFGLLLHLDRAVSGVPHEVTSTAATDASGQQGGVAFATTHWSVVLEAQSESPAAQEALEKLCRTYWRPIFAFLRRQGFGPEEGEDITQGFFAELLERRSLSAVRKEKGRLRSFLLGGLKYFLANERRRTMAIKRGKGQQPIPLEEFRGGAALFDSLKELLPDEPGSPSQAAIAARLGMTENAVRQAFYRFRQRYQAILREEIANTVATPGDIEDELLHLIAVLEA